MFFFVAGFALAFLIFSSQGPFGNISSVAPPAEIPGAGAGKVGWVHRVIDGDTVEMTSGVRVRYIGMDTPELRHRVGGDWVYRPQPYAEEARAMNQQLVQGKQVRLEFDQERKDSYQRDLAYIFVGDVFVNAELVRAGYARVFLKPPNLKYANLFMNLQEEARTRQKGIWERPNQ